MAGEPQPCHQPAVRGRVPQLLWASESSPEDHASQGALWFFQLRYPLMWTLSWVPAPSEAVFSPQESMAGEEASPGIRHLGLPCTLSNLGQTPCPHLHRWVPGQHVPSAGRRWGRQACWGRALGWKSLQGLCTPGARQQRGPQLPLRGSACSISSSPSPENTQRHARWRLGPGNSASPLHGLSRPPGGGQARGPRQQQARVGRRLHGSGFT